MKKVILSSIIWGASLLPGQSNDAPVKALAYKVEGAVIATANTSIGYAHGISFRFVFTDGSGETQIIPRTVGQWLPSAAVYKGNKVVSRVIVDVVVAAVNTGVDPQ